MKFSIENFVFGAIDGTITTFAVVAGVVGASLSPSIVLILGFANLLADGFSMSIGNYLATKTRNEYIAKERKREEWEIENMVEQEKQEIRDIYAKKGFEDELLEDIVSVIIKKRNVWIDTMMKEELGLIQDKNRALDNALNTFIGFNVIGLIPLVPYIFLILINSNHITANPFFYSIIFTAVAFFLIGSIRGKVVKKSLFRSGLNTLLIGGIAASLAYMVGHILGVLVVK
jgi:VIT1/CCC1 family predicted Fe2+/Mn2+ transporter